MEYAAGIAFYVSLYCLQVFLALYVADVMYWEEWPVAQPALLFAWKQYGEEAYYQTWRLLEHFPENEEVIRNLPVRSPVIWIC